MIHLSLPSLRDFRQPFCRLQREILQFVPSTLTGYCGQLDINHHLSRGLLILHGEPAASLAKLLCILSFRKCCWSLNSLKINCVCDDNDSMPPEKMRWWKKRETNINLLVHLERLNVMFGIIIRRTSMTVIISWQFVSPVKLHQRLVSNKNSSVTVNSSRASSYLLDGESESTFSQ